MKKFKAVILPCVIALLNRVAFRKQIPIIKGSVLDIDT